MAKKRDKWAGPLVLFLVDKVGMKDAIKVATFIVQWGTVSRKLGREPTGDEYCEDWLVSRATYFRALQLFHNVWPDDRTPQRVWEWVEDQVPAGQSVEESALAVWAARLAS